MPEDPKPAAPTGGLWSLCPRCHHIYAASETRCVHDQEALTVDERILAGKFILTRKIGEGGMGEVYEAEQPPIGRTVAVKLLRADPEVMKRFESEVQAVGAINHPEVAAARARR